MPNNCCGGACAREYDVRNHVQAMEIEGIDVASLYGRHGRQVLMHADLAPAVGRRPGPQRLDLRLSGPSSRRTGREKGVKKG